VTYIFALSLLLSILFVDRVIFDRPSTKQRLTFSQYRRIIQESPESMDLIQIQLQVSKR
jgi:hypothetical protein